MFIFIHLYLVISGLVPVDKDKKIELKYSFVDEFDLVMLLVVTLDGLWTGTGMSNFFLLPVATDC